MKRNEYLMTLERESKEYIDLARNYLAKTLVTLPEFKTAEWMFATKADYDNISDEGDDDGSCSPYSASFPYSLGTTYPELTGKIDRILDTIQITDEGKAIGVYFYLPAGVDVARLMFQTIAQLLQFTKTHNLNVSNKYEAEDLLYQEISLIKELPKQSR